METSWENQSEEESGLLPKRLLLSTSISFSDNFMTPKLATFYPNSGIFFISLLRKNKGFSIKPIEEVNGILEDHQRNLGKWIAQEALATELTRIVHGSNGLETALRCSRALFQG